MRHNFLHTIKRNTRLLLTAITLFCITQLVCGGVPSKLFFCNKGTDRFYIYAWQDDSHNCAGWAGQEMTKLTTSYQDIYYKDLSSCTCSYVKCIFNNKGKGGANNYQSSDLNIPTNGKNICGRTGTWGYYYYDSYPADIIKDILDGTTKAYYIGNTWNNTSYYSAYIRSTSNTQSQDVIVETPLVHSTTFNNVTCPYGIVISSTDIPSTYYMSDNPGWEGIQIGLNLSAGNAYFGTSNTSLCSGSTNWVCEKSGPTLSYYFNSDASKTSLSITSGTSSVNLCAKSTTAKTAVGNNITVQFYTKNGSTYTKIGETNISAANTEAPPVVYNTSSLAVGEYTIYTLYVDASNRAMCVKGSALTLTVTQACTSPTVTSVTDGSRCGAGTVNISATASSGVIKWYTAATEGTYKGQSNSGATFTTESISSSTKYYAEAYDECASQSRTEVSITINTPPSPSINGEDKICVNLSSAGRYESSITDASSYTWSTETVSGSDFSVSSGGGTSDNYVTYTTGATTGQVTVNLTVTDSNGCTGSTSKSVTTVNRPTISSATTGAFVCGDVAATISATSSAGKIKWYDASTSGNKKGESDSGADYTTDAITTNTSYYAEAADGGCPSAARTEVAIVHYASGPTIEPSSGITQYEPVTVTGNSSSTWSVTTNPASAGYLSTESGTTTTFKAPSGSYTVTDTNTGCGVNITVAEDTEDC